MTAKKEGIHAAFVKAQAEMTNPKKGADNPFFNSKYADLTSCWLACKGALAEHDIGVMQGVHGERMMTTLIHSSGETLNDEGIPLVGYANAKNPMQAMGAAITYARRYGLCSMLGMAPEDDDGNSLVQDTPQAISAEQATELQSLAEEVGADIPKFCEYLGVKKLADVDVKAHEVAVAALEKKRAA